MAKHEFGIMPNFPDRERYDAYTPEKYNCISVDDDNLAPLYLREFCEIPCCWHGLDWPERNLACAGITLIPPESLALFLEVFRRQDRARFGELIALFEQALSENKFIIHFGI